MDYNVTFRKKDKGLQAIISYKDNTGKWKQKSKQGFKTQKDAKPFIEKTVKELEIELLNQENIINSDYKTITFLELFDLFIKHNKLYKEQNTIITYENAKAAFKELWELKVVDIKKIHVQKVVDTLTARGIKRSTIELHLQKISLAVKYYKDNYDSSYKAPVVNIVLPKQIKTKIKVLTKNELDELLDTMQKNEDVTYYIAALLAGYCGLRIGEILGLTWNDIIEEEMKLNINKQWKLDKNGNEEFGKLKTENGYREIPISKKVISELKKYKKNSITDINKRLIVVRPNTFNARINEIINKYKEMSIHELRHTYATLLIQNEIDFKTVAKFMGHDVSETIATYSHVNDDMLKNATDKIKNIF